MVTHRRGWSLAAVVDLAEPSSRAFRRPLCIVPIVHRELCLELHVLLHAGHLGGLAVGLVLGYAMGPRWVVRREVDIPPGSLAVPEDAREVAVVVDATPAWQRAAAAAGVGAPSHAQEG